MAGALGSTVIRPATLSLVISQIIGGLGNQMFQYAVGRALSLARNQPLRLDISGFPNRGMHQGFELHRVFNCAVDIAGERDLRTILGWHYSGGIRRVLSRSSMAMFRRSGFVVEPHFHYWPEIMHVPQDSYLAGYWQSEKYFQAVHTIIRTDFSFKPPLTGTNADLADQIGRVNAVSLHVRRGDYASNAKTNSTHGLCSIDYYRSAIQYVAERVDQPYFFLFSDDMAWVKKNLVMDFPCRFVDQNQGAQSFYDMRLMQLCRHQIIANSSFSWWGAWLNSRADKIVVAPNQWFRSNNNTSDLLPQSWVKL